MAASSSSPLQNHPFTGLQPNSKTKIIAVPPRLYDVFINHRGPDTKKTLAHSLYNRLKDLDCKVFLDSPELELGEWFPSNIANAIASSWLHIAVFSKTYAESPWCLAELAFMLKTSVKVIPVFYDVKPWELRHIEQGKGSYAHAFAAYQEKGRYLDRLQEWKDALRNASFITGLECSNNEKLCDDIVREVLKEKRKWMFLKVAESSVGLDQLVEEFEMLCKLKEEGKATVVGIFGMGGSGKTTLAKELFNRWKAEYDASSFLFDVREASVRSELTSLQAKLLNDLVVNEDRPKFWSVDDGISYLMHRLGRGHSCRFLIVVDDIDHKDQFKALVPREILNTDSLIIVITRDESVLREGGITLRYKMKVMNKPNSRELFCWTAFRQPVPASGYEDLVEGFVEACGGLPLALQVMGGHVFGANDKGFWELELNKVRQTLDRDIKKRLRISFDGLERHEQQIFMDIACFFISSHTPAVIKRWWRSGCSTEHAIRRLKDKCLIEEERLIEDQGGTSPADGNFVLRMHDHLRDLGRQMAEEFEIPIRWWRPEFLESLASKGFQYILSQVNGRSVRCIHSMIYGTITYVLWNSVDCPGSSTALLYLEIDSCLFTDVPRHCLFTSIPSWIPLQDLLYLRIHNRNLKSLWKSYKQAPLQLKELELLNDYNLCDQVLNELGMYVHLECLVLEGYATKELQNRGNFSNPKITSWKSKIGKSKIKERFFSDSLRKLTKLKVLRLSSLYLEGKLDLSNSGESASFEFPPSSLESISLKSLGGLSKILISGEHCPSLQILELSDMKDLIELHLPRVTSLERLSLRGCSSLKRISGDFDHSKLVTLEIRDITKLKSLSFSPLHLRRELDLRNRGESAPFESAPSSLQTINLNGVRGLSKILISASLQTLELSDMEDLTELDLPLVTSLERLSLRGCYSLKRISGNFDHSKLVTLEIRDITKLKSLNFSPLYLRGELDQSNSRESASSESQPSSLPTINLKGVRALSKILISGCLQTLELSDMGDLTELDLPGVTSLERLSLRGCHRLKRISGDFDHSKLATMEIRDCLKLEEMPNLALLHCLKKITIDDGRNLHNTINIPRLQCLESVIINLCPKLQDVTGIEDLEGLKCLHLFAGNRAVSNCIANLKRLPSEVTCIMARAYDGIEATLNASFFRDVIDNARSHFHIEENVVPHFLWDKSKMVRINHLYSYAQLSKVVTMGEYTSIVCGVVESSSWVTFKWTSEIENMPKEMVSKLESPKNMSNVSDNRGYPYESESPRNKSNDPGVSDISSYPYKLESLVNKSNYFDGISGRIPGGRWMFIIANTGKQQLDLVCPVEPVSIIKKLCKVIVHGEDTGRVLSMFRSIALATVSRL